MVERELSQDEGPAPEELGFADEAQLAAAIRDGELDGRADEVGAFLRRLVQHRLAVAHPGYAIAAIADRLFSAIEAGDADTVADMWADDITVWQLGDGKTRDKTRALRVIEWFMAATTERHYDVLSRQALDGGFVQQHVLHGTARDGTPYSMRVAIIIAVGADGRITRVDEYFDPAALDPLNKQVVPSLRR
ncbi:MAG: nuclear transport factor 2 family protein [Mycobacteriaceae bacterium]|nr:nuclear transport factor 2 family protein [Mycobacteriaceae bacterium]